MLNFINCDSDSDDQDIIEFYTDHSFTVNNNKDEDIIISSFLNESRFQFKTNPQIDTILSGEQKNIINVGFIGESKSLIHGELFGNLKIETTDGAPFLSTNAVDTLNWAIDISAFKHANELTYTLNID